MEASFPAKMVLRWRVLLLYVEADSAQNWGTEVKAELC